jgi:protein ImuB
MLWLCLELPALRLEAVVRAVADAAQPLALVDRNRIEYCNAAAAECGVAVGSSLATAASLCRGLRHFGRNTALEQARLKFLAATLYRFSDRVSLHEPAGNRRPAALLLEVSGSLKLFGGLYALKRQAAAAVAELGHRVSPGIGHTPLAALALARAGQPLDLPPSPAPQAVQSACTRALRSLRLAHTEIDEALVERLGDMGIDTLGQLLRLPTTSLGRRFGTAILDYLGRLSGRQADPRLQFVPSPHFDVTLPLLEGISNKQVLLFPMQRLLKDLEHWLVSRQLGVVRLRWSFTTVQRQCTTLDVELSEPTQRQDALLDISRLKLDASTMPAEVLSIALRARELSAWSTTVRAAHGSLFARPGREAATPQSLVDRFRARLGRDVCHGIAVHDDVRPEHAWKPTPPALKASPDAGAAVRTRTDAHARRGASAVQRPLWLLAAPMPVAARQLTLLHGPERIECGWWEDEDGRGAPRRRRDYYVARHASDTTCWVFRDGEGRWYVHGCFA